VETTFTIGVGAAGILVGAGIGFGIVRGKLSEVERLVHALFTKFDKLVDEQHAMETQLTRHEERIDAIKSDMRELRGTPRPVGQSPTGPIDLGGR
jgi:hypothetical protein